MKRGRNLSGVEVRKLVERFKAGDNRAFAQIYEAYKQQAYAFALRFLGRAAEAEDVAQEAFVRVFRYIHSFNEGLPFKGWLFRIVYNICLDARRLAARERENTEELARNAKLGVEEEPLLEREELLQRYLARLDGDDRAILILYYLQDNSYEDISHILAVPLGTVKSRLFRAKEKLREIARLEG